MQTQFDIFQRRIIKKLECVQSKDLEVFHEELASLRNPIEYIIMSPYMQLSQIHPCQSLRRKNEKMNKAFTKSKYSVKDQLSEVHKIW